VLQQFYARRTLKTMTQSTLVVLTIGGLDPSGGAGLPADARACAAFGVHACGIATAVIAQNTQGVQHSEAVSTELLEMQLDNLLSDITPHAIKIGMLPNVRAVRIVAQRLEQMKNVPVVLDTVFAPSSGPHFSNDNTIEAIRQHLLPRCTIVTPNIPEAAQLLGHNFQNWNDIREAAQHIHQQFGPQNVLLKGGHSAMYSGQRETSTDIFFDGHNLHELHAPRIEGIEVRGTGCQLASAIAAQLAGQVLPLPAAQAAKDWLTEKIKTAHSIGKGRRVTF
jgi:hydroxymethylpyrimidine kinase/phosphomethylpyrimidine kinase